MGKRALTMRRMLLATSSKESSGRKYSRGSKLEELNHTPVVFIAQHKMATQKRKGGLLRQPAFLLPATNAAGKLEGESDAEFQLTRGIGEVTVGVGNRAKWRIEVDARRSRRASNRAGRSCRRAAGRDEVTSIVHASGVDMVEEVVSLRDEFGVVALCENELL